MQDTFRPPWFHRNIASRFMGLVRGVYDAKADGFAPGGCSLHNCMTGHGPDAATFEKTSVADTRKPDYITDSMAIMFETRAVIRPTAQAMDAVHRQLDYPDCWMGLKKRGVEPAAQPLTSFNCGALPADSAGSCSVATVCTNAGSKASGSDSPKRVTTRWP